MKRLMTTALTAALAVGVHPALAELVEKRATADPRGEVEIVNVAGEVHVIGWDKPEVHVSADLSSGVERLRFDSSGRRTIVEVEVRGNGRSGSSDLVVHIPRDSALTVNTVSAEQTIEGVRGSQRLQAVSGSIITETWGGEFEAKTVSGEIDVRGHGGEGSARVNSVSGDIQLRDIGAELDIETVTGDMRVSMDELSRGRIKTTNGDLELSTRLSREGRLEAEAINGDLRFMLHSPVNAEVDIETFNGDIDNCFGPQPRRTREFAPGNELRFTEGKGDARIRIKTLNGGVELCKK